MKNELPEQFRFRDSQSRYATFSGDTWGLFHVPRKGKKTGSYFQCLVSDGMGWDHVSISIPAERRCPTWEEMCYIKDLFFSPDECVVQFHPSESDYVNNHPYCLHLWKVQDCAFPAPLPEMVGIK